MKKNRDCFTEDEITLLKINVNIAALARKHKLSSTSNYAYKVMRKFPKTLHSASSKFIQELELELEEINKKL